MLQKSQSKKSNQLKLAIVLPFLALFLMSFNVEKVYIAKAETTQDATASNIFTITSNTTDQEINTIKDQLEAQTDGLKIKFSNVKRNLEGKITNLSIETKLKSSNKFNHNVTYQNDLEIPISNINLKIENGELVFGDQKQNLVMRVTERGVIADKFPLKEKISSTVKVYSHNTGDNIKLKTDNKKETNLNTKNIDTVNILKGETASLKYEDKNKNGVAEIVNKEVTYVNVEANNVKETITVNQTTTNKSSQTDRNKALIIIDGVKTKNEALKALNPDMIKSMSVLKDEKAIKAYGEEGKNGIILITTKQNNKTSSTTKKESNKKSGPWKISNAEVVSLTYTDDEDATKNGSTYFISMITPKETLEQHKRSLQTQGIELKYLTIKRNNKDKITKLKMSITNNKGANSKVLYQSNKGIPNINITIDADGEVNIESQKQD